VSVELYRQGVDAWNDRDAERFIEFAHPDIEFRSRLTDVEGAAYNGHEGVRRYFADLAETFDEIRMEIKEIEERGDWVVATLWLRGKGAASGATVEWEVVQAARIRDGLWVETVSERNMDDALDAAGLR
jgi:ketosteroid isomerase-like protein